MADDVRTVPRGNGPRNPGQQVRDSDLAHVLRALLPEGQAADAINAFQYWDADGQQRALELIQKRTKPYFPFYCRKAMCDGRPHDKWEWNHARYDQRPPKGVGEWFVWLLQGGRGSGKTRAGAEYAHQAVEKVPRIALIAPTGADVRDTMVEGESGILATAPPGNLPKWEPSKRRLTWPKTNAIATTFSGEEPDRLRGPQHYWAWIDEPAHMPFIEEVWSNLLLGLRLGRWPRICATTTPTPIPWMRQLAKDRMTVVSKVSTYANLDNLAEPFRRTVLSRYEGTRLGRQELHGEILEDVEGALWSWELIEAGRVNVAPPLDRILVSIDPAGSARRGSDETGIVVVGRAGQDYYVLDDGSGRMSPNRWASKAIAMLEHWQADALVAERNYGGDMVRNTLRTIDGTVRIIDVTSRRGKVLRAEPVVSLYEQRRVHHVGQLPDLEDQQTSWVSTEGDSPDRVDALVHGITELERGGGQVQIASPTRLRVVQGGLAV